MQKSSLKVSREKNVLLNPSSTNISLLYPLKTSENLRFSVLGGIKAEHCVKMRARKEILICKPSPN